MSACDISGFYPTTLPLITNKNFDGWISVFTEKPHKCYNEMRSTTVWSQALVRFISVVSCEPSYIHHTLFLGIMASMGYK